MDDGEEGEDDVEGNEEALFHQFLGFSGRDSGSFDTYILPPISTCGICHLSEGDRQRTMRESRRRVMLSICMFAVKPVHRGSMGSFHFIIGDLINCTMLVTVDRKK